MRKHHRAHDIPRHSTETGPEDMPHWKTHLGMALGLKPIAFCGQATVTLQDTLPDMTAGTALRWAWKKGHSIETTMFDIMQVVSLKMGRVGTGISEWR